MFYGFTKIFEHVQKKIVPEPIEVPVPEFNEQDIAVLASMCVVCEPIISVNKGRKRRFYSYYILQDDTNTDYAKSLFEKNGIHVEKHKTKMLSEYGDDSLRVKLDNRSADNPNIVFMNKVKNKFHTLPFLANQSQKQR